MNVCICKRLLSVRNNANHKPAPWALLHLIMMYIIASDGAAVGNINYNCQALCACAISLAYRPQRTHPSLSLRVHCSSIGTRANVETLDVAKPRALRPAICNFWLGASIYLQPANVCCLYFHGTAPPPRAKFLRDIFLCTYKSIDYWVHLFIIIFKIENQNCAVKAMLDSRDGNTKSALLISSLRMFCYGVTNNFKTLF